jgi:glucan 1,3-beta-glucosidase
MPVTYADVWEFWLRHRDLAAAVDFITIHILPYWEDVPIPAHRAAPHVDSIRKQVVAAFPGKDVLVGEFGWPSAGRMREGALPSPANQARAMHEALATGKRGNYRINLIEAYDQPWKRKLEGTVGGHWGLYDSDRRQAKFTWGDPVPNHPHWRWQAAAGVALAAAICAIASRARSRSRAAVGSWFWPRVAALAVIAGTLLGMTIENVPLESLTFGDWLRSLAWAAVAITSPLLGAAAIAYGTRLPSFAQLLGRRSRACSWLRLSLGAALIVLAVLAVQAALGLVFDPRYRDFPFAPLTGAVAPFLLMTTPWRLRPKPAAAEAAIAATLAASTVYIVFNEGFANWQALWFGAGSAALALTLVQVPDVPD